MARLLFFTLSLSSSQVLGGVAKVALDCAHRTRVFLSRAFCEQGGHLAAPHPLLLRANATPLRDGVLLALML